MAHGICIYMHAQHLFINSRRQSGSLDSGTYNEQSLICAPVARAQHFEFLKNIKLKRQTPG